jgi:hypothetical protein
MRGFQGLAIFSTYQGINRMSSLAERAFPGELRAAGFAIKGAAAVFSMTLAAAVNGAFHSKRSLPVYVFQLAAATLAYKLFIDGVFSMAYRALLMHRGHKVFLLKDT